LAKITEKFTSNFAYLKTNNKKNGTMTNTGLKAYINATCVIKKFHIQYLTNSNVSFTSTYLTDGWMAMVLWHFKHANSSYITPEIV